MLLVWEWLLFHLLKECYFSHCTFLSLEIGLELTQIIRKSQEKNRKQHYHCHFRSVQTVPLTPGLPCLPIPMMRYSATVAENPGQGSVLCILLHQSQAANDSYYPLWTLGSPQFHVVRSIICLGGKLWEWSEMTGARWSATHSGWQVSTGAITTVRQLQSLLCICSTHFLQSASLSAVWQALWHTCILCLSLAPQSEASGKGVTWALSPILQLGYLLHPSLSDDSFISHLLPTHPSGTE